MALQGAACVRLMPWPTPDLLQGAVELRREGVQRQSLTGLPPLKALNAVATDRMAGQVALFLTLMGLLGATLWCVRAGAPDWVSLALAGSVSAVWVAVQWLASRALC